VQRGNSSAVGVCIERELAIVARDGTNMNRWSARYIKELCFDDIATAFNSNTKPVKARPEIRNCGRAVSCSSGIM
jgi:hypothetical protein